MKRTYPSEPGQWVRCSDQDNEKWVGKTLLRDGTLWVECVRDYDGRLYQDIFYRLGEEECEDYIISEEEAIRCLLAG